MWRSSPSSARSNRLCLRLTVVHLCLTLFPWAKFRKRKAAVKLHTLLDLRASIPTTVIVTTGAVHDVNIMDELFWEPGSIYVMDRAMWTSLGFTASSKIRPSLSPEPRRTFASNAFTLTESTKPPAFAAIKPWCFAVSTLKKIIPKSCVASVISISKPTKLWFF